jgi:hypothetical protein
MEALRVVELTTKWIAQHAELDPCEFLHATFIIRPVELLDYLSRVTGIPQEQISKWSEEVTNLSIKSQKGGNQ